MTDGTTGFQVAPITEDEMGKVHDILRRAADAIVGMSQLKHDVDALSTQVRQLSDDCERLRKANAGLEESLYQARNHRQELESRLAEAEQAKATAQREAQDWQAKANTSDAAYQSAVSELDRTRKDRDDAELEAMSLEDQLKSANAMLDKMRGHVENITSLLRVPEPAPAPPTSGSVVQQPAEAVNPTPAPEPTPTEPAPAPVSDEVDWQRPYHWDSASGRYVND